MGVMSVTNGGLSLHDVYLGAKKNSRAHLNIQMSACKSPAAAFACVAVFFAGRQEAKMEAKLKEYGDQHEKYKTCLQYSKEAAEGKSTAASTDSATAGTEGYKKYMKGLVGTSDWEKMDKCNDNLHNKDEWQAQADVINQEKDIQSTELNKISSEMDRSVKDSGSASEIATNAVTKAVKLASTQSQVAGG